MRKLCPRTSQQGALLLLLAITLPVFIAISAFLFISADRRLIRSKLRLAVDSASHAAAAEFARIGIFVDGATSGNEPRISGGVDLTKSIGGLCLGNDCSNLANSSRGNIELRALCKTEECYENTLLSAERFASNYLAQFNFAQEDLEIQLERGMYREGGPFLGEGSPEFPALPGVPNMFLINAVRVTLTLQRPTDFFGLGEVSFSPIKASSVAIAGSVSSVDGAPFAIPYCSLVNNGSLATDMSGACSRDVYFTATRRLCPDNDIRCGVLPGFNYDLYGATEDNWAGAQVNYPIGVCNRFNPERLPTQGAGWWNHDDGLTAEVEGACGWATAHFDEYDRNFGFLGLPVAGFKGPINQENVFKSALEGQALGLGDEFEILKEGLNIKEATGLNTTEALWSRISGIDQNQVPYGRHVNFPTERFKAVEYNIERSAHWNPEFTSYVCSSDPAVESCALHDPDNPDLPSTIPLNYEIWFKLQDGMHGACNSKRDGFGFWSDWLGESDNACVPPSYVDFWPPMAGTAPSSGYAPSQQELKMWKVMAAVIADESGATCTGIDSATKNPDYLGDGRYWVIGLIPVYLFDVDIGNAPPTYPSDCYSKSYRPMYYGPSHNGGDRFPWGFRPDWYNPTEHPSHYANCNLLRARLPCEPQFLLDSSDEAFTRPLIVE